MSEKRFHQFGLWVIDNPNFNGISIADLVDTKLMSITEVVDKLNELFEENEQLRQQVQNAKEIAVKNDMQYQICRKEKEDFQDMCEQLRQRNDQLSRKIEYLHKVIREDELIV